MDLLDGGRVVGLHQGRSESGPRALGNRSILADARHPGMQTYINASVKGREWFRPLAPIVLWEAAPGSHFPLQSGWVDRPPGLFVVPPLAQRGRSPSSVA